MAVTYKVQPKDTLSGIAAKFGTTAQKIKEANPSLIKDIAYIQAGWTITIPTTTKTSSNSSGSSKASSSSGEMDSTNNADLLYDHNVARCYYQHIPNEKVTFPPLYSDNIANNMSCKSWTAEMKKAVGPDFRDIAAEDYFRIGDCVLRIPPQQISVKRASESNQTVALRQRDSIKTKSGYRQREITLPITFNGLQQINGYMIPGPNGGHYVDGLRPLLAQIKKTPFLPIDNYELNIVHGIHAVVVSGLNIRTVQGFPNTLEAELVCYETNLQPYITLPNEAYTDMIDWDLFRWYYNRSLFDLRTSSYVGSKGFTYLKSIPEGVEDYFAFTMVDEDLLAGNHDSDEDAPKLQDSFMKKINIPSDVYITSMQVGIGNIIKNIQLSNYGIPSTQYLGATGTVINCTFETSNSEAVRLFNQMAETSEYYARTYRNRTTQGFVGFENPIAQLFGVEYVMIENIVIDTVPDFPGSYTVNLLMSSFDSIQPEMETPKGFSPVGFDGKIEDFLNNNIKYAYRQAKYDQIIEDMLDSIDLYPDLELPTYKELNDRIAMITKWRKENGLTPLPYSKIPTPRSSKFKVDPDFYMCYPTLEQSGLYSILEENNEMKAAGAKVANILKETSTGWYSNKSSVLNYKSSGSGAVFGPDGTSYAVGGDSKALLYFRMKSYANVTAAQINEFVKSKIPGGEAWCAKVNKYHPGKDAVSVWRNQDVGNAILKAQQKSGLNAVFLTAVACYESGSGSNDIGIDKYNFYSIAGYAYDKAKNYKSLGIDGAFVEGALDITTSTCYKNSDGTVLGIHKAGYTTYPGEWSNQVAKIMGEFFTKYAISQVSGVSQMSDNGSPLPGSPIANVPIAKIKFGSGFGMRMHPTLKVLKMHWGVDIGLSVGTPIVSVLPGSVIGVVNSPDSAMWYVKIKHDNTNITTTYCHLSQVQAWVGMKVEKGTQIGLSGGVPYAPGTGIDSSTGKALSTDPHLHFEFAVDGEKRDPVPWLKNGDTNYSADPISMMMAGPNNSTDIDINSELLSRKYTNPAIDYAKLGKPLKGNIAGGNKPTYNNTRTGLVERMCVDMVEYNKRGTLCRAFPSYVMLFVDEGMWLDGRKLWSNYYAWHSICDITVEKNRKKPADTAIIKMTNIYNSLGTNPKVYYGEQSWWKSFKESLQIYSTDILSVMVKNRNRMLSGFNVKTGARIHLRMGYGNMASKLPIAFNGIVAEVDTQDMMTVVCQGDGYELTNVPLGSSKEDETNGDWIIGCEPQNIISYFLVKRSNDFLMKVSGGKWGETSQFGIEHFGNLYYKDMGDLFKENFLALPKFIDKTITGMSGGNKKSFNTKNTELIKQQNTWMYVLPAMAAQPMLKQSITGYGTAVGVLTLGEQIISFLPFSPQDNVHYESYDLLKNIYLAKEAASTEYEGDHWWLFDGENNLKIYLYNRTPWDVGQILAGATPEFIFQPHAHGFRSTLFFGMPTWNVRYKYEYKSDSEIYQYAKPFSQMHVLSSVYDVVDNKIKAVQPAFTCCIPTYDLESTGSKQDAGNLYADRYIKSELQKTVTLDTNTRWDIFGPDKLYKLLGYDQGGEIARRIGISSVQDSFKDMYDGGLIILGDASIKPHDTLYLDDMYVGMNGTCEVGSVVHHMGLETGFVTDIKPDLCVAQSDVDNSMWYLRPLAAFGAGVGIYLRAAWVSAKVMQSAKAAIGATKIVAGAIKGISAVSKVGEAIRATTGVRAIAKGINAAKSGLTTAGIIGAPESLGTSLIVAAVGIAVMQCIDVMLTGLINYIRNSNVIKIYPLWYKDKPYVAGINGHKNLIPGYADEDFYPNMGTDEVHMYEKEQYIQYAKEVAPDTENMIEQEPESVAITSTKGDIDKLNKFNTWLSKNFGYGNLFTFPEMKSRQNTGPKGKGTYRPILDRYMLIDERDKDLSDKQKIENGSYGTAVFLCNGQCYPVFAFASGKVHISRVDVTQIDRPELKGIDWLANQVDMASDGREDYERWKKDKEIYNTWIVLEHKDEKGNKFYSEYMNLGTAFVVDGQQVAAGQCIGCTTLQRMFLPTGASTRSIDINPRFSLVKPPNTILDVTQYITYKDPAASGDSLPDKGWWGMKWETYNELHGRYLGNDDYKGD